MVLHFQHVLFQLEAVAEASVAYLRFSPHHQVGPTSNAHTNRQQPIENNSVTTSFYHFFAHNSLTSSILRVSLTIGQLGNRKKKYLRSMLVEG